MSNRRLAISSLLCNDDEVPIHRPRPTSAQTLPEQQPPPALKSSFLGLEALVHAATEERRRISGGSESAPSGHGSPVEDQPLRTLQYQPSHQIHQTSPRPIFVPPASSPVHVHSPTYSSHLPRSREHVQILQSHTEQRPPVSPFLRQEEEMQRYQYFQRQRQEMLQQEQRSLSQRFQHSDASRVILPPLRSPTAPFQIEEPEQLRSRASPLLGRPRSGSFVTKYPSSPMQVDIPAPLAPPRGSPRLPTPIMREPPLPPTMSPSTFPELLTQSPRDFQPTLYHDTAVQFRRDSMSTVVQSPVQPTLNASYASLVPHQDTAIPFRRDSPLMIVPPVQQTTNSPQTSQPQHQRTMTLDDFPPSKRRRHSDSPLRLPAIVPRLDVTEQPRVLEQRLNSGPSEPECGAEPVQVVQPLPQPVPPPIAAARGPTILPRKPSHEGGKKSSLHSEPHVKERESNKVASSSGRRSPPGSVVGRAKAAKKIDEMEKSLREATKKDPVPSPVTVKSQGEYMQAPVHGEVTVGSKQQPEQNEIAVKVIPGPAPSENKRDESHERSPQRLDRLPSPPPSRQARSIVSTPPGEPGPTRDDTLITISLDCGSPVSVDQQGGQPPAPLMSEEAVTTFEQELEEILAEPEENKMDVDVTQLVAETLDNGEDGEVEETDGHKQDPYNSDVDSALLRLLDEPSADSQLRPELKSPRRTESPTVAAISLLSMTVEHANPTASPDAVLTPSERGSMPPPSHQLASKRKDQVKHGEEKKTSKPGTGSKKKEMGTKPPKPKPTNTISKAKSTAKLKGKTAEGTATPPLVAPKSSKISVPPPVKKSVSSTAASRSRSASVMPGPEGDGKTAEKQEEEESSDGANDDDKLYCVCKTKYDEERFMIACDKCDDWYHMQCVNISELEADLVDQFFCPTCIESNPHSSFRTTYKQRCLNGLKHNNSRSSDACHQPALGGGILSKFCSQDCGIEYMTNRIDAWVKKGGKREKLWESVKHAEKREGIVIEVERTKPYATEVAVKTEDVKVFTIGDQIKEESKSSRIKATKSSLEIERLKNSLARVVKMREEIKNGMEVVLWRERLLELATDRAQIVGQCGWDQRLCFGDEEWTEFGMGVLESYETSTNKEDNDMQVDGAGGAEDGEWWCPGRTMCDRHAGWQNIRAKDITKEQEQKEEALTRLTTRERELRKRIEDLVDPHSREIKDTPSKKPLKLSNPNGRPKNGHFIQKGKKRKNIVHC